MTITPTTSETQAIYEQTAMAMLQQLRALALSVPGFAHVPALRRRKITTTASLPDAYLHAVSVACDASEHLALSSQITGAELRDGISFSRAFRAVADELELIAYALRGTVAERRYDIGRRALRAYSIAKGVNGSRDSAVLIPHVATMARTLNRSGRKVTPDPEPDLEQQAAKS